MRYLVILILLFSSKLILKGQIVIQPLNYNSNYVQELLNLTLINNSGKELEGIMRTKVLNSSGELLIELTSPVLKLRFGTNYQNMNQYSLYKKDFGVLSQKYPLFKQSGELPPGTNTICYTFEIVNSEMQVEEYCYNQVVLLKLPVTIVSNQSNNSDCNPLLSWIPVQVSTSIKYNLLVSENLDKAKSIDQLIQGKAIANKREINQSSILLSNLVNTPKEGHYYSWKIQVVLNGEIIGESEIETILYSCQQTGAAKLGTLDSYVRLKPRPDESFHIQSSTLRLLVPNHTGGTTVNYSIQRMDDLTLSPITGTITANTGLNYIDLSPAGLTTQKYYLLTLTYIDKSKLFHDFRIP